MQEKKAKTPLLSRQQLLAVFDEDEEQAEAKYAELYHKLLRFFEWRKATDPSDLVQETITRGLQNLQVGKEITTIDPAHYFMGIARNVEKERWKRRPVEPLDEQELFGARAAFLGLNLPEQKIYLKECLSQLSREEFELLLAYIEGAANEWGLARGLQPGAVRLRVHRLRKRIEHWVDARTSRAAKKK